MNREKMEKVAKRLQYFVYGNVEVVSDYKDGYIIKITNKEPELVIELTAYSLMEKDVKEIVEILIKKCYNEIAELFFKPRHIAYGEIEEEEQRDEKQSNCKRHN